MRRLNKLFSVLLLLALLGCSSMNSVKEEQSIEIKNNILLYENIGASIRSLASGEAYHKFKFSVKADREYEITSFYLTLENPKKGTALQEVIKLDQPIHLVKGWDWKEIPFESQNYGPVALCKQFNAMVSDNEAGYACNAKIQFNTKDGKSVVVDKVVLQFRADGWFRKVMTGIQKYGCDGLGWVRDLLGL